MASRFYPNTLVGRYKDQAQPLLGGGNTLMGLLGDPRLMMGLQLLSAGRDRSINPYGAALQGLTMAQSFRDSREERDREKELYEWQKAQRERMQALGMNLSEQLNQQARVPPVNMQTGQRMQGPPQMDPRMQAFATAAEIDPMKTLELMTKDREAQMRFGGQNPVGVPREMEVGGELVLVQPTYDTSRSQASYQVLGSAPWTPSQAALSESIDSANAYDAAATSLDNASRLRRDFQTYGERIPSGWSGKIDDLLYQVFGSYDVANQLRQRQRDVSMAAVLAKLPPGVASDNDVMLARSTVPPEFASPEAVIDYLKSVERGSKKIMEYAKFKERHLLSSRRPGPLIGAWEAHVKTLDWWEEGGSVMDRARGLD